jgi:hypothetical protein
MRVDILIVIGSCDVKQHRVIDSGKKPLEQLVRIRREGR